MSLAPDKPDWRWHAVTDLLEFSHAKAVTLVQRFDVPTQRVYKFRRQFKDRLVTTLPDYVNAHSIWLQRPYQRAIIEGLLIGGADDDIIQGEMEIDADDIAAYVAMFFDVRGRRRMDVSNMVFQGMPHKGYHAQDRLGVMQRLGWFGGYKLIQSVLAQGLNPDEAQSHCAMVCKDIVRRQLPEFGLAAGVQTEFMPEYLRLASEWDDKGGKGASSEAEEAILSVMDDQRLTVADGSDKANLMLPAAEPRYVETLEVHNA